MTPGQKARGSIIEEEGLRLALKEYASSDGREKWIGHKRLLGTSQEKLESHLPDAD